MWRAVVQEAGDLDRMGDEREAVQVARLTLVPARSESERIAGERGALNEVCASHLYEAF